MKIIRLLLILVGAGFLAWLTYNHFFPNEEKRIRKMLTNLASAASIPEKKNPLGAFSAISKVQDCFETNVEIKVESRFEGFKGNISGREELMEFVKLAWARYSNVKVEFLDITVTIDPSNDSATAMLTTKVTKTGERDFLFQEFEVKLLKHEGDWRIAQMTPMKVLH